MVVTNGKGLGLSSERGNQWGMGTAKPMWYSENGYELITSLNGSRVARAAQCPKLTISQPPCPHLPSRELDLCSSHSQRETACPCDDQEDLYVPWLHSSPIIMQITPWLLQNLFIEKSDCLVFTLNFKTGKLILLVKPLLGEEELFT